MTISTMIDIPADVGTAAEQEQEGSFDLKVSEEERPQFLADIIDTEGYAIKGAAPNSGIKDEIYAEANDTLDMFEDPTASNTSINQTLQDDASARRNQAINQMRAAIANNANQAKNTTITHNNQQVQPAIAPAINTAQQATQQPVQQPVPQPQAIPTTGQVQPNQQPTPQPIHPSAIPQPQALPQSETANMAIPSQDNQPIPEAPAAQAIIVEDPLSDEAVKNNDTIIKPDSMIAEIEAERAKEAERKAKEEEQRKAEAEAKRQAEMKEVEEQTDPNILNLANNTDFSIETIAKQAKRIKEKKDDEVYISLH